MPTTALARRPATRTVVVERRRKHRRGRRQISLAIIGGMVPLGLTTYQGWQQTQTLSGALHNFTFGLTGYESVAKRWDVGWAFKTTWGPILLGALIHKGANRLGINRALRLPFGIGI